MALPGRVALTFRSTEYRTYGFSKVNSLPFIGGTIISIAMNGTVRIAVVAGVVAVIALGIFVDRSYLYYGLFAGMILMHLVGHGGHGQHKAVESGSDEGAEGSHDHRE